MKNFQKSKALLLSLMMVVFFVLPMSAQQTDGFFRSGDDDIYNNRDGVVSSGITNNNFQSTPLGSGLLIMVAAGAGYAIARRKRNRKGMTLLLALALVLGLTQCKKNIETITPAVSDGVNITLNVDNGSRVIVDPTASQMVTFESGDQIIVISNGVYVGYLQHNGTTFTGSITNPTAGQPLYFYFFSNRLDVNSLTLGSSSCPPVYIGDQTNGLPVISMAPSKEDYSSSVTSYSAVLENYCSLMKFNVTAPSTAPICITGMCNAVTPNFAGHTLGQAYNGDGLIMMKGVTSSNPVTYAVVLSQEALAEGATAMSGTGALLYTADHFYSTTRPAIPEIRNGYLYDGTDAVNLTLTEENNTYDALTTPLTFEARTAGAKVTFNINAIASNPVEYCKYGANAGCSWQTYTSGTAINLENVGDKVMFRGTNNFYSTTISGHSNFSCSASCFIYGNIMSLIDKDNMTTATFTTPGWDQQVFQYLFNGNTNIDIHTSRDLVLPATELVSNCYSGMFKGCTGLTKAPALPATTLASGCYSNMFCNCSNLETAPVLPASTLTYDCYCNMFEYCAKINSITCLATSDGGVNDFSRLTHWWLDGVASSGTFITPATSINWPTDSPHGIPVGWTRVDYVAPTE